MKKYIVSVVLSLTFSLAISQNTNDWANTGRYEKANSELTVTPKVAFIGNSITDSWYQRDPEFFDSNNFACRGINGQVTSQMLVRFRSDIINIHPQAVVILAGINDIAQNQGFATSVQHIYENIVAMAELAKINKIKVIMCTLVPADIIPWRREIDPKPQIAELNAKIVEYARANHFVIADVYGATVDETTSGLKKEYRREHDNDAVHPGLAGYKVIEQEILRAVKAAKIK